MHSIRGLNMKPERNPILWKYYDYFSNTILTASCLNTSILPWTPSLYHFVLFRDKLRVVASRFPRVQAQMHWRWSKSGGGAMVEALAQSGAHLFADRLVTRKRVAIPATSASLLSLVWSSCSSIVSVLRNFPANPIQIVLSTRHHVKVWNKWLRTYRCILKVIK